MSGAVKPLGVTVAGSRFVAGLAVPDARFHIHVPGVTGTGKTTLLANMVLADARASRGAVVLDPKGDMICDLLARLPARASRRRMGSGCVAAAGRCTRRGGLAYYWHTNPGMIRQASHAPAQVLADSCC